MIPQIDGASTRLIEDVDAQDPLTDSFEHPRSLTRADLALIESLYLTFR